MIILEYRFIYTKKLIEAFPDIRETISKNIIDSTPFKITFEDVIIEENISSLDDNAFQVDGVIKTK